MTLRTDRTNLKRMAMCGAAFTALMGGAAVAEPVQFTIAPGSLGKALNDFSMQSDREILVASELVTGKQTGGITGAYEPEEALGQLLSNAGLSYRLTSSNVFLIDASQEMTVAPQQETGGGAEPVINSSDASSVNPERREQTIVVVGSHIQGARTTEALPVTLIGEEQLAAIGADSGDDLFRSIPQMGDVSFNSSYLPQSSNAARGDVGSVNLRNLGIGNTLVLLNGRRVVQHPTSRANENLVPVLTYNTNAIPTAGVRRIEVLRDGAAAIYGADAVAGVVNTVLREVNQGGDITLQYGKAEGTGMEQFDINGTFGTDFLDGRGNVSAFLGYTTRSELSSTDQDWTATADRRSFFEGTNFEGIGTLDRRSTISPWGNFAAVGTGTIRQNGTPITTAAGAFSIVPDTNTSCLVPLEDGVCLRSGTRATTAADRNTRYDWNAIGTSLMPEVDRINLFSTARYDLENGMTAFGELGYYQAETNALQVSSTMLSAAAISVPASNYWNPFGPITFEDGTPNPNRLPGLDISPDGAAVTLSSYRFDDFGLARVNVKNDQYRILGGLRGQWGTFDWESALVYSEATVRDRQDGVSATRMQEALSWSTPDAYNPFNGGNPNDPSGRDTNLSNAAAIAHAAIVTERYSKTTLSQWDFKLTKGDIFSLPGGDVGMATGVELRRDTQLDDRDPHVDGTLTFTNVVTGNTSPSDLIGTSDTPDTKGSRSVGAAFVELAVPLVSPEMNIPLVQSLEMQAAGRYENYSDFGDIAKPKVALAWTVVDGLRFRGSWAQSFRAPNLEQVNATVVSRSNTRTDWVRCEADLRAGRITSFTQCGQGFATTGRRSGNPDLKAETADTWTVGAVLQPRIIPDHIGSITFTADLWNVEQEGLIGIYGEGNALILDYLLRTQGSSNPDVVRADPTADEIAAFAGTGLDPVGRVLFVTDSYRNLQPQTVKGLDLSAALALHETPVGRISIDLNVAHLLEYERAPSPDIQSLLDARAAGDINANTIIPEGGDLLRQNGSPSWKWNASLTWQPTEALTFGAYTQYIGSFFDTTIVNSDGENWRVDDQQTVNFYAQYAFDEGIVKDTRIRLGVRNATDELPPMDSSSSGYNGALYQPYGRYWYASIRKSF